MAKHFDFVEPLATFDDIWLAFHKENYIWWIEMVCKLRKALMQILRLIDEKNFKDNMIR